MQTESDATCLARVLPERPSPYPPSLFLACSSFSSPYLLLSSRWLSARARPQAHFYWRRRRANVQVERRGGVSLVKFQNLFVKRCFPLFLWIMGRQHNGCIFKWSTSVTKRLSFLFDFNLKISLISFFFFSLRRFVHLNWLLDSLNSMKKYLGKIYVFLRTIQLSL